MKNMWIIAKKDLGSFFSSPVFYSLTYSIFNSQWVYFFQYFKFFQPAKFSSTANAWRWGWD